MKTAIELAREAGFNQGIEELTAEEFAIAGVWVQDTEITELVEHLVELARADEREGCAKACEEMRPSKAEYDHRFYDGCTFSAAAIRARGNV